MPNPTRLQMIQAIITRLAGNSAALKGFAVTIVTALLGISINAHRTGYAWLAVYPIVVLGLLDAYYLALEQNYRSLYDEAAEQGETVWSLAARKASVADVAKAVTSASIWGFYAAAFLAIVLVALVS
jgi:hypothetical protein